MTSQIPFRPPSAIEFENEGGTPMSPAQYCGVCQGVLNVQDFEQQQARDDDEEEEEDDASFPLPSSAAAVGTVHPCGHLFHVSCFHNHNSNKKSRKRNGNSTNPMVEIMEDDHACVELKSSDEFEDTLTHEDFNECPLCRKRAFLFVEMASMQMKNPHHFLRDAAFDMRNETDDDADTDIMNYYSFANSAAEDSEQLYIDTANVKFVDTTDNVKQSFSDASTEFHDLPIITNKEDTSDDDYETEDDDSGTKASLTAATCSRNLLYFDSQAIPSTPGIMITPGTMQRRKSNKKVRFFDDQSNSLLETKSESQEGGDPVHSLLDQACSDEDDRDDSEVVEITSEDIYEEEGHLEAREKEANGKSTSTNLRGSPTEESHDDDEMLNLANALVLPSADSRTLFWNVSSIEEDEDNDKQHKQKSFVDKLQGEIDELRHQLIQSEQEKEEVQRVMSTSRVRELGAVAHQAKEIAKLKKEVARLTQQQKINQQEIMTAEEELAQAQIQLETAVDDHQQAQSKMQEEFDKSQEELEEVKYQLESCQQDLEEEIETSQKEKEELVASHKRQEELLKQECDKKIEAVQEEMKNSKKELEAMKDQLKACEEDKAAQMRHFEEEKEALILNNAQCQQEYGSKLESLTEELSGTKDELDATKSLLSQCQSELSQNGEKSSQMKECLEKEYLERERALKEAYDASVRDLKKTMHEDKLELEASRKKVSCIKDEVQKLAKTAAAFNTALIAKHKSNLNSLRVEYEAKLGEANQKLEQQTLTFRGLESAIKESKLQFETSTANLEAALKRETQAKDELEAKLEKKRASREPASGDDLREELEELRASNEQLKAQFEELQASRDQILSDLEREKQSNKELNDQLQVQKKSNEDIRFQLEQSKTADTELVTDLRSQLDEHIRNATILAHKLQDTQHRLKIVTAELEEAKSINFEESEEMNAVKDELESTRHDMEKLIENMHVSEREMLVLRKELNAAKDALAAATNDMDLERTSTSTSSLSPRHSIDESACIQSLQEELRTVKQELAAKNQFIQGQLTSAKEKLLDYVRTKEGELEKTKKELTKTKQTLKNKEKEFSDQLQETEHELYELSSMRETLLATMNELAEKNSIITSQLMEAQSELAFLAETNQRLQEAAKSQQSGSRGDKHAKALSAPELKFGNAFAVAAVFMGHWLSECAKNKFNLTNQPKHDHVDPIPEIDQGKVS